MKIVILDSGVNKEHTAFRDEDFLGYSLRYDKNGLKRYEDYSDENGHGTAIYHIIRKRCREAQIKMIKIFDRNLSISGEAFYEILRYVNENEDADIINLSLGITVCSDYKRLYDLCKEITERGILLVSAFDNNGAVSYPAAFDCVIGVDGTRYISSDNEYTFVESSIVNMITKGGISRLAWNGPDYILTGATSFACAYATSIIANQVKNNKFDLRSNALYINKRNNEEIKRADKLSFKIQKAAIFPFNKEMHSIVRFSHMLEFEIESIYDVKYSGKVHASTRKLLNDDSIQDIVIKDIKKIQWDQIDTLIIGHLDELTTLVKNAEIHENLIRSAVEHNINIYSFDPIELADYKNTYYPHIEKGDVPNNFGKMYQIATPVLGVFGTSSQQGKFTIQLTLRDKLSKMGYSVGQLGTEPSALLYGMDEIFAFGYNRTININEAERILVLNEKMRNISSKDHDIIIVGSQSGTIPYGLYNLVLFPIDQIVFLYGTCPDAVILAINAHDEIEYIKRTISFIESAVCCKVIGLCLFPMKINEGFAGMTGSKVRLTDKEVMEYKNEMMRELDRPVFELGCESDMGLLTDRVLNFFGGEYE